MSAVKTNKVQIGQSATPGLNITIETPAVPDGSFSIRKGVHDGSGAVLLNVDAAGNPTFPTRPARTLQDVLASRATGVTYTNSTPQEIIVYISVSAANAMTFVIDGKTVFPFVTGNTTGTFIIPPGSTYSVPVTPVLVSWFEYRV
jgi:hypothetical protein